jgi:DNA-binding NtrC family response regulator
VQVEAIILVYGRDHALLDTRKMLLQKTGLEVLIATELAQTYQVLADRRPDLLVLCHTVPCDEAKILLEDTMLRGSKLNNIILTSHGRGCSVAHGGFAVDTCDGPKALLASVKQILGLENYAAG